MAKGEKIAVEVIINSSVENAWKGFTNPESVKAWNFASDDWCCPKAQNDIRAGGAFNYRMEANNGKGAFDFCGTYTQVDIGRVLEFELDDGRVVRVVFNQENGKTRVTETFEAETENTIELQRSGWQAILNNYAKFVEGK